ncbi:uncharacterized protein LOC134790329 [Cydia splendana]|uniref:uncharacterized protein LOC134790329 n=1 Tax=Cydia splendana TaxID=1100963 RepID=UPI00300C420E
MIDNLFFIGSKYFVLSMATAWRNEGTSRAQCNEGACGLGGSRLEVLGRGAVPAGRRLLARLAPGAPFHCLQDWNKLRAPECGFIDNFIPDRTPCSNWSIIACSAECVTVAIEGDYEEEQCELAQELAEVTELPLRLTYSLIPERTNSSYLLFDFDILMDSDETNERIWPAPSHPNFTLPDAVSLSLGDVRKLLWFAPQVLNLAYRFQPTTSMLRRVLANSTKLGIEKAACEAIVASNKTRDLARSWLTCNDNFCNVKPKLIIYVCEAAENKDKRYGTIIRIARNHWRNTSNRTWFGLEYIEINCSTTDEVKFDLEKLMTNYEYVRLRGVVAMGSGGASPLPEFATDTVMVPLLLVAPSPSGAELASARSTAPSASALAAAVRALMSGCGWRRVALLREEGRCDVWKRSLGVAELLSEHDLIVYPAIVQANNATGALDALQAHDARVVVIDASAGTAKNILATAEKRGHTMKAGYVWIVVGAAGNSCDSDWLPTNSDFSYLTVSGGWRGGLTPNRLLGSSTLRDTLDKAFPSRWPPHTSALVDAILLVLEGTARFEERYPEHRDDPHRPDVARKFLEILDSITVPGVTRVIHANSTPLVFAHRWTSKGVQLVAAWDGVKNIHSDKEQLCGAVVDGPGCYTTRSGDYFTPHCHDFAWAILACALAFGLPSLYAAHVARRRRLQRRDRAVEERVLLRGGHSAAEAAAGAALAEHAVPRDALQLLDELGTGHYGVVHQAVLRRPARAALGVAVKAPRADAPAGAAAELLREAALLATLKHDHVVRFTGVCWEGGPLVLMEHAFYGDLRR